MKRILIIVVAVLMLTVSAVFGQETATELEIKWEDVASVAGEVDPDGGFQPVSDTGLEMWFPSIFVEEEVTDEDLADGMVAFYSSVDASAFVAVNYIYLDGAELEDAYAGLLIDENYEDVEMGFVNDLKVLSYEAVEEDMTGLSFIDTDGYMIQFLFYPASDEGFSAVAALMGASIRVIE